MATQVIKVIVNADAEGRYLSAGEMDRIKDYVSSGEARLRIAQTFTDLRVHIVEESIKLLSEGFPEVFRAGGNAFGLRKATKCLRDLDYYLRLVTYGVVAGDVAPIEEIGLIGAREMYISLGTPLHAIVQAIYSVKLVASSCLSDEDTNSVQEYFDYIINYFSDGTLDTSKIETTWSRRRISFIGIYQPDENEQTETDCFEVPSQKSWEPNNFEEMMESDSLIRFYIDSNLVDDEESFKESCRAFYESWKNLPYEIRRRIWREREITSHLSRSMSHWEKLPGFSHVGVSCRQFSNIEQLVGVLVFADIIVSGFPENELYERFKIPKFINIDSTIEDLDSSEENPVPVLIDLSPTRTHLSTQKSITATSDEVSDIQDSVTEFATVSEKTNSLLQVGDVLFGGDSTGYQNTKKRSTLSYFAVRQPSEIIELDDLRVLGVWHGFDGGLNEVFVEDKVSHKIGEIVFDSKRQQELCEKLDVCLIKPLEDVDFHPHLKWADSPPGGIAIPWGGMLVQMWGGQSGHVTGFVNVNNAVFPGPVSSAIPEFTAIIESKPGDSGALLVAGNGTGEPVENPESKGFDPNWINTHKYACLGILVQGPAGNSYRNLSYFRPIADICQQLKIKPCLQISL